MDIKFDYQELKPLSELKDSPYQRNKHTQEQIERLAKLMKVHGVRQPIHISKRSGCICFGHGRKAAALFNNWRDFPVVYQDFATDEEEYTCVQSDNAIAEWSELDLKQIEEDIAAFGGDYDHDLLGLESFGADPEKFESELDEGGEDSEGGTTKVIIHLTDEEHLIVMRKVQACCEKAEIFDLTAFFIAAVDTFAEKLGVKT